MSWNGSTDIKDRVFSTLPYLLPLFYAMEFGQYLFQQFPFLRYLEIPLIPVAIIFGAVPFGLAGIIIFFVLFLAVVQNERISRFIRFNTMQSILLNIGVFLISFVARILARGIGGGILLETLYNLVFLAVVAACGYSIIQALMGRYAEIPTISEAAHMQVR